MACKSFFARLATASSACVVVFCLATPRANGSALVSLDSGALSPILASVEVSSGAQPAQGSQEVLTNEDVVKMVQAHLGVDVIVEQIRSSFCNFSLSTSNLIKLKQLGVPDKVIAAMQEKGNSSRPTAPTGGSNVPPAPISGQNAQLSTAALSSAPGSPFPDLTILDADAYNKLTGNDPIILSLNFMRLVPHALDDEQVLRSFACLNNRGNRTIVNHLASEFDRPQTLAYYKANADKILAGAPTTILLTAGLVLGEYDEARHAFPLSRPHGSLPLIGWSSGTGTPASGLSGCGGSKSDWLTSGSPAAPGYRQGAVVLMVLFRQFYVTWLPMDEESARRYVDGLRPGQSRAVTILSKIDILQKPPEVVVTPKGSNTVAFEGEVRDVTIFDRPPDGAGQGGHVLATISPYASASLMQQASASFFRAKFSDALGPAQQACIAGDQDGCGLAGYLYAFGLGVAADPAQGMKLMANSCNVGSSAGCDELGLAYYFRGGPVPLDLDKALQFFAKSCDGGFALGCVKEAEATVEKEALATGDPYTQQVWDLFDKSCLIGIGQFANACSGGYAQACVDLGRCYARGVGVNQDMSKAKQLYQQACSLGDKPACKQLPNLR